MLFKTNSQRPKTINTSLHHVANRLKPVDRMEVLVLVDNVTDLISSHPEDARSEIQNLKRAGWNGPLQGDCLCAAHWGLSLAITVWTGERSATVLFDTGPEPAAIARNSDRLGFNFQSVESLVISHGHWDHVGAIPWVIRKVRAVRGTKVATHVNDGMFLPRGRLYPDGSILPHEPIASKSLMKACGAEIFSGDEARMLLDERVLLSGEIPRHTKYELGLPGHVQQQSNGKWVADPWLIDERYLAVDVKGRGIVVLTACAHAGIINTLQDAACAFPDRQLYGLVGGFHLSGAVFEKIIDQTVGDLQQFSLKAIIPGHCTGWRAIHSLVDAFGEGVVTPSAVGMTHIF